MFLRSAEMPQGKIKRLVTDRGFGFLEGENGNDLFFHHSEVNGSSFEELREGQNVSYTVGQGKKGPCATSIRAAANVM
jgi:CspA family cold shock protein